MTSHLRRALCEPAIACRFAPGAGPCARRLRRVEPAIYFTRGSTALTGCIHAALVSRSFFLSLVT